MRPQKQCPKCGRPIEDGDRFCIYCGFRLPEGAPQPRESTRSSGAVEFRPLQKKTKNRRRRQWLLIGGSAALAIVMTVGIALLLRREPRTQGAGLHISSDLTSAQTGSSEQDSSSATSSSAQTASSVSDSSATASSSSKATASVPEQSSTPAAAKPAPNSSPAAASSNADIPYSLDALKEAVSAYERFTNYYVCCNLGRDILYPHQIPDSLRQGREELGLVSHFAPLLCCRTAQQAKEHQAKYLDSGKFPFNGEKLLVTYNGTLYVGVIARGAIAYEIGSASPQVKRIARDRLRMTVKRIGDAYDRDVQIEFLYSNGAYRIVGEY